MPESLQNLNDDQDQDYEVPDIDLDFHVEFPTAGESPREDDIWPMKKDDSSSSGGKLKEEKAVLVILLGWAGCTDKYLAKYSDFYLKRGCIVLRYITPMKAIFLDTYKLPIFAARIVRLLKDLQLSSHPTFFHTFSNGGSFIYSNIMREVALADINNEFDFRASIFDSAPAPRQLKTLFKVMTSMFQHYNGFKYVIAVGVLMLLVAQIFWYHLKSAFRFCLSGDKIGSATSQKRRCPDGPPLHNWLKRISLIKNHRFLFLYSDEDELIPSFQVENIARVLKDRGNQIELHKFNGSEHVQHYRKYPQEYINTITQFIRKVMEEKKEESDRIILWNETE